MTNRVFIFSLKILVFAAFAGFLLSCSTKKNTFTRRTYHNLTAHYNAYFNGKEALKDARNDLSRAAQDNFSKVLPIVNYGTKENVGSVTPGLDRAIAKASLVVSRHSIYIKNVEHVRWIDDAYLLMGKANFFKQDYKTAYNTFDFIQKRYKKSDLAFETQLWMARCNIRQEQYTAAMSLLDDLLNKVQRKGAPSSLKRDIDLSYAEMYLDQNNYSPAEEYLIKALQYHHPKAQRARLHFILGQIELRRGDIGRASRNFSRVIHMNPNYELAFNARINLAKCYDASAGNREEIVKTLKKMLRDEKNKDYLDQVYAALAEIAEKDGDSTGMKENLRLAVASSTRNKYQKGVSSLKLANIFYREPEYQPAQAYYDTAVQSLPADYPDLVSVKRRASVLNDLVKNLTVAEREDSLQRIAKMPEAERNKIIDGIIAKIKEEEMKKQKEQSMHAQGMSMMYRNRMGSDMGVNPDGTSSGNTWYFYNPSAISFGFTEFEKKWGKRKLEDNWRLSDKEPVMEFDELAEGEDADSTDSQDTVKISKDPKERRTYEQNLPLTEAQMEKSNKKLKEAMFNLGGIYYHGLSDYDAAAKSYEKVIDRFPEDSSYLLKSCYNLYEAAREQQDRPREEKYKNMLISMFPDSDYARLIRDPSFKDELISRKNKASGLYREAYLAYDNQQYQRVMNVCQQAKGTTRDKHLLARFDFLESVSTGKLQGKDTLQNRLRRFIGKYPSSDLLPLAQQILEQLSAKDSIAMAGASDPETKPTGTGKTFIDNPDALHLFIIAADIKKINVNALKVKISDHNLKYNSLDKLSTSSLYLDDTRQLITVSNFATKELAMNYYVTITGNNYVFSNLDEKDYDAFVITVDNYPVLYKTKDTGRYLDFFRQHYLGQK